MGLDRRRFGKLTLGAVTASAFSRPTFPQTRKGVIFLAFAGATADAWRRFYAEPFQKQTGIAAKVIDVSDPLPWYMGRGTEFNSSVQVGVDYWLYEQGKVEPLTIAHYPILSRIPERFWTRIDAARLLGMPVYQQAYGIAINTKLVKRGEITSWFDLANPKYKGKVATNRYSEVYDVPWFAKISGGDESHQDAGLALYERILANSLTIPGSMAQTIQLLQRGDVVAAPFYSARIWTLKKGGDYSLDFVIPKEGVPLITYHLQLSKAGPDLDAARRLAAYAAGAEPAQKVADALGYFPVNQDAHFPAEFNHLMGMSVEEYQSKLQPMDYVAIGRTRQDIRDRIDQINAKFHQ